MSYSGSGKEVGTESTNDDVTVAAELPTGGLGFLTFFEGSADRYREMVEVDGWEDWNDVSLAGWLGCAKRRVEVVGGGRDFTIEDLWVSVESPDGAGAKGN